MGSAVRRWSPVNIVQLGQFVRNWSHNIEQRTCILYMASMRIVGRLSFERMAVILGSIR